MSNFNLQTGPQEEQKMARTKSMKDSEARVREDIVKLVRYCEDSFALGVKYQTISQKYYKKAERAGCNLRDLVSDLVEKKQIYTYMNENGAVLVMVPEMAELIQQDDYGLITEEAKEILKSKWKKD